MRLNASVEYDFDWNKTLKGLKLKMSYSKSISTDKNSRVGSKYTCLLYTSLYVFNKVTECFHAVYDDMKNYSENIQVIKLQNTAEGDVLLLTKDKDVYKRQVLFLPVPRGTHTPPKSRPVQESRLPNR